GFIVDRILCERNGHRDEIRVREKDYVIVTLGSMTEASSVGSMDSAPILKGKRHLGSWALWENIADGHPQFGHPANFSDHIEESKWVSCASTLHDLIFFNHIRDLTGNIP